MPTDMTGAVLGHYRILRELGRGGMGIVYLAADTRLEREVALKVLSAASDVGETRECLYIAMEYVEGETLPKMLSGGGSPSSNAFASAGR